MASQNSGPDGAPSPDAAGATTQDTLPPLRTRLRARRAALGAAQRGLASEAIMHHLQHGLREGIVGQAFEKIRDRPVVVAAFWPMPDEPDLRPLMTAWSQDAVCTIALPAIARRAAPLIFLEWTHGTPMREGHYCIPEPQDTAPRTPDVLLVPTLGFTSAADRVGYGGGYYDRTLAALQQAGTPGVAVGIAFDCGRLQPGEHQPAGHDVHLDAVVTESGWVAGRTVS